MRGASTRVRIRVRYGETDKMGVVYHGNYFRFFEVARVEILRGIGHPHREMEAAGVYFVVAETGAKFVGTATYDDLVEIHGWIAEVGKASARFEYEARVIPQDRLTATGFTVLACVDGSGRILRLPRDVGVKLAEERSIRAVEGDGNSGQAAVYL